MRRELTRKRSSVRHHVEERTRTNRANVEQRLRGPTWKARTVLYLERHGHEPVVAARVEHFSSVSTPLRREHAGPRSTTAISRRAWGTLRRRPRNDRIR